MANDDIKNPFRSVEPDDVEPPPHYREGRPQKLTTDTGRQGPSGWRVLVVLVLSLVIAIIFWGVGGVLHWW